MAAGGMFRRAVSGQPLRIPAAAYNAMLEAALAHRRGAKLGLPDQLASQRFASTVLVRNDSGADRARFDVLALGSSLISAADDEDAWAGRPAFAGTAPQAKDIGRGAVLLGPVPAGTFGLAAVDGVGHARVRMISEQDRCADVDPASPARMRSCEDGAAQLLWVQPVAERAVPDIALCLVRFGPGRLTSMHARVTAAASMGANRWRASWQEARPNAAGTAWSLVSGGFTQATHGFAYNGIEAGNTGSGVEGSGVDVANLGTFAIKPLGSGKAVVELKGPYFTGEGVMSWWISAVNVEDGVCP